MSRLPSVPVLEWRDGNIPYSTETCDIYYSVNGGLGETRRVFIDGCGLPLAWENKHSYTVGELGFGTGLNFLALWDLWNASRPSHNSWLEFVSFENSLLTFEQANRALSRWKDLTKLSKRLLGAWPNRATGIRRLEWADFGVGLTIHIGEIRKALPASRFIADAWFLDGFAPSRNPEMWTEIVFSNLAERSKPNTRLATYSVAGSVRRGLERVGFKVSKETGHGSKRERLEGKYVGKYSVKCDPYGIRYFNGKPKRVAILGAGIGGANLAWSLSNYNCEVNVFDRLETYGLGASRNRLALVMPRLDATDTLEAKILIDAYIAARECYKNLPGVYETEVLQHPRSEKEEKKFTRLLLDPPLSELDLEGSLPSSLLHKRAMIVRPETLIETLLHNVEVINRPPSQSELSDYDIVVVATGFAIRDLVPWLDISPKLGQVEYSNSCSKIPASAKVAGNFVLSVGKERFWGSTFEPFTGDISVSVAAKQTNLKGLQKLHLEWFNDIKNHETESRASVRATTPDRLPLIGAIPDYSKYLKAFNSYRNGTLPNIDCPLIKGWYICSGFGTRGFTWGPWAASTISAMIMGKPIPATEATLKAISPARQILKKIKKVS